MQQTPSNIVSHDSQVVFLTDALSVLQSLANGNLPQLEKALHNIKGLRTVLQWIPAHCGKAGNKQAGKMAKMGARDTQVENAVSSQR